MENTVERLVAELAKDAALARKVEEAWKGGVDADALAQILSEAGIEAGSADVEAALANVAKQKGSDIADEGGEVEDDELSRVAGGIFAAEGRGGCDDVYYIEPCSATVEQGSWCNSDDFCETFSDNYRFHGKYRCEGNIN